MSSPAIRAGHNYTGASRTVESARAIFEALPPDTPEERAVARLIEGARLALTASSRHR